MSIQSLGHRLIVGTALCLYASQATAQAPGPPAIEAPAESEPESADQPATLDDLDVQRLTQDRDYAAAVLEQADQLRTPNVDPQLAEWLDTIRLSALVTLERRDEAKALVEAVLRRRSAVPEVYTLLWWDAVRMSDYVLAAEVVEAASRNVRSSGWAELREALPAEIVAPVLQELRGQNEPARIRLARGLFNIGWNGDGSPHWSDNLRSILLAERLEQGDRTGAASYASGMTTPNNVFPLILQTGFDDLIGPGRDRLELLREALDEDDRLTREKLAEPNRPRPLEAIFDRAVFLRSVGRDAEALALLEPYLSDIAATVASDDLGMWAVDRAARSMLEADRQEDAVSVMRRLVALPLAEHPDLIGPSINFAGMLLAVGRPEDALQHLQVVEQAGPQFTNDFGKLEIATAAVCAHAQLGQTAEAGPWLARLRAAPAHNFRNTLQGLICLNDLEASEALILRQLGSDDPGPVLEILQDYQFGRVTAAMMPFHTRLMELRERPAVRAAIAEVGRVLSVPMSVAAQGLF
jgi:hypothetical protein